MKDLALIFKKSENDQKTIYQKIVDKSHVDQLVEVAEDKYLSTDLFD